MVIGNLAMMSKDRNLTKKKANSKDKCFNCEKLGHWRRNCTLLNQGKKNKPYKSSRSNYQQAKRNCANIAASTNNNNFDCKPFKLGIANIAKKNRQQAPKKVWYLDSWAFWHLTNNRDLFIKKLRFKCLEFTIANGQTLCAKSIKTIAILLDDKSSIRLEGVVYAPKCDLNFILLGQLHDSNITYVNNPNAITLIQRS